MSRQVVRSIGVFTPPPPPVPEPVRVQVIEASSTSYHLSAGGLTLATASSGPIAGKWTVNLDGFGIPRGNLQGFFVTGEGEAINALSDIGKLYVAAKTGALK